MRCIPFYAAHAKAVFFRAKEFLIDFFRPLRYSINTQCRTGLAAGAPGRAARLTRRIGGSAVKRIICWILIISILLSLMTSLIVSLLV